MLDWLFIIFMLLAVILIFLAIEYHTDPFWSMVFILVDIMLWFVLAASVMQIEIPYQMYNASSGNIEVGYHNYASPVSPAISYFFAMMGIIMTIYFVGYVFGPIIFKKFK